MWLVAAIGLDKELQRGGTGSFFGLVDLALEEVFTVALCRTAEANVALLKTDVTC